MYFNLIGVDGAGKDVQIELLKKVYPEAEFVYEPGGTQESDLIRDILLVKDLDISKRIKIATDLLENKNIEKYTFDCLVKVIDILKKDGLTGEAEMFLYAAARCENIFKRVKTHRNKSNIIGSRSIACSMAYQAKARNLGFDLVWEVNQPALDNEYPDLEIFLDLPIEVARKRLSNRSEKVERFDEESEDFFNLVRSGYMEYYKKYCPYPYVIVDADNSIEDLHQIILQKIKNQIT